MNTLSTPEWVAALFEDASDALFLLDPASGHILHANPQAHHLTGQSTLASLSLASLFRADSLITWNDFQDALGKENAGPFRGSLHLKHAPSEQWVPVQVTVRSFAGPAPFHEDTNSNPRFVLARDLRPQQAQINGIFKHTPVLDVVERQRAEQQLRHLEAKYRNLVEMSNDLIWSIDAQGHLTFVNRQTVRAIFGYEPEEILNRPFLEFLAPENVGRDMEAFGRMLAGNPLSHYETIILRKDGTPVQMSFNAMVLRDDSGQIIGATGTGTNITLTKVSQDALRSSEARYRTLIESLEQSIFLKDRNLRFLTANKNYCHILGCTEAELLGKTDFDFFPSEIAEKYRADDLLVLQEGRHVQTEERRMHHRQTFIHRSVKTPVMDEAGNIVGVLGILWDVTEHLSLETQLRHVQKMDAIGQLAGGVAHDFNNLLTVILGNLSYVVSRHMVSEEGLELLKNAEQAGLRSAELTQRLLSFSRRTTLRAELYSLNVAVQEAVNFLRPTIDPRIELESRLAPNLWSIKADPGLINQLLMNLAINARDAMPNGGKLLFQTANFVPDPEYLRLHLEARPGEFVHLRVQDTGHGMTSDVRQRIFEPFFTTKEIGKGTGLGLATVFTIVRQHGGWIVCESQVKIGTTFDVFLPRTTLPVVVPQQKTIPPVDLGTETLLLVDDEPMVRNLGSLVLRKFGYKVLLAEDGRKALEIYQEQAADIDLIILDGTMPRLSGRDTLRELVRLNANVRVLFSSGYTVEHLDLADFPQVVGFMHKPYRVEDLAAKVRSILDKK
jgi:two-component system cell cycle sensor histidine kinase/response regulator CckA